MSQIEDFVVLNITKETAKVTQAGFGTTLFLGPYTCIPDTVKTYTDPADMLTDGFLTTDALYIAALKHMSQELSPEQFKIARKGVDTNEQQKITANANATAGTWTITWNGLTTGAIAYDAATSAIETAIEALTGITSVTVTGTMDAGASGITIEWDGADASTGFTEIESVDVSSLTGVTSVTIETLQNGQATQTWAEAYAATTAEDNDFYFLVPMLNGVGDSADIQALAALVEADLKLMGVSTDEAAIITSATDDTASDLQDAAYDRTFLLYSEDEDNYPIAGLIGGQAPKDPGSITWKFKTITGITPDTLTASEKGYAIAKNCNVYETVAGLNMITSEGVVASGEYIDIMRGTDWLQVNMSTDIFRLLYNSDKVPFTTPGIAQVGAIVAYWLNRGVDVGLLQEGSIVITLPKLANIPAGEKSIRYLNGITFSATYAGAIHKVGITGKISAA